MNTRLLIACGMTIITILLLLAIEQRAPTDAASITRNDPDLFMTGAEVIEFDTRGQVARTLAAERFTHFPLTDITTLQAPAMTLFDEAGSPGDAPWQLDADLGRILPRDRHRAETIELWQSVRALQKRADGNQISIVSDSMTVVPADNYLETDDPVAIKDRDSHTTAAGMRGYLNRGRFMFYSTDDQRVQTTLLPTLRERLQTGDQNPARQQDTLR